MIKEGLKAGVGPSDELIEVSFAFSVRFVVSLLELPPSRLHTLITVLILCGVPKIFRLNMNF